MLLATGSLSGAPPCADLRSYVYELRLQEKQPAEAGPEGYGRGIFLSEDGAFLTALHLFEQSPHATRAFVQLYDGRSYVDHPVEKVIGFSRGLDIALAKIALGDARVKVPQIGSSVHIGEPVIGFRSGLFETVCTSGQVSAVSANKATISASSRFLLPGSSGAPIFDSAGQVVAIAVEMVPLNPGAKPKDLDYLYAGVPVGKAVSVPKLSSPLSLRDFLAILLSEGQSRPGVGVHK